MMKVYTKIIVVAMLVMISFSFASAITGKIGNGRMVVTLEQGETLERTIRVINDNDVTLNITLFAEGDLADDIEVIDNEFTLEPGEEKRARFTLEANEVGNYESRINVQFTPVEGGNGVGLSAIIITKVVGEGSEISDNSENNVSEKSNNYIVLIISTVVLIIILIGLILLYSKKKSDKKEGEKMKNVVKKK